MSDIDDNSWEQVYGLMRCSTKFEKVENPDKELEFTEIEYFDY
jgi:hypothetical protein